MLTFLEGQALQKRDCPSKIGMVDNGMFTYDTYSIHVVSLINNIIITFYFDIQS